MLIVIQREETESVEYCVGYGIKTYILRNSGLYEENSITVHCLLDFAGLCVHSSPVCGSIDCVITEQNWCSHKELLSVLLRDLPH